jgi:hypothetical protein
VSDETARWAFYKQYDEVNQNFRTVWQLYLAFYTAALTINVAALAFVHGTAASPHPIGWVTFAFVSIDLLIVGSSVFVWQFTRRAVVQAAAVAQDIGDFARAQGETLDASKCFRQTLPSELCYWAAGANIAGMLLVSAVWFAMYLQGQR